MRDDDENHTGHPAERTAMLIRHLRAYAQDDTGSSYSQKLLAAARELEQLVAANAFVSQ